MNNSFLILKIHKKPIDTLFAFRMVLYQYHINTVLDPGFLYFAIFFFSNFRKRRQKTNSGCGCKEPQIRGCKELQIKFCCFWRVRITLKELQIFIEKLSLKIKSKNWV